MGIIERMIEVEMRDFALACGFSIPNNITRTDDIRAYLVDTIKSMCGKTTFNIDVYSCKDPYVGNYIKGCRCKKCTEAYSDYMDEFRRTSYLSDPRDIALASKRLHHWIEVDGISINRIVERVHIGKDAVRALLRPSLPKQMRGDTVRTILEYDGDLKQKHECDIDAAQFWALLDILKAHNITKKQIANQTGIPLRLIACATNKRRKTVSMKIMQQLVDYVDKLVILNEISCLGN